MYKSYDTFPKNKYMQVIDIIHIKGNTHIISEYY